MADKKTEKKDDKELPKTIKVPKRVWDSLMKKKREQDMRMQQFQALSVRLADLRVAMKETQEAWLKMFKEMKKVDEEMREQLRGIAEINGYGEEYPISYDFEKGELAVESPAGRKPEKNI